MKRISYSDDFIITADDVADALLQYASILARTEGSDVVEVPALDHDGRLTTASLVLGPASQLIAVTEEHAPVEMDVTDALRYLNDRIDRLSTHGGVPFEEVGSQDPYPDEY